MSLKKDLIVALYFILPDMVYGQPTFVPNVIDYKRNNQLITKFSAEMLGFETLDPTTAYLPHNLTITSTNDIDIDSLKELQRGHFTSTLIDTNMGKNFEKNVSFYEPAPLDLYTKFSMQTYFLAFWIIIILQSLAIFVVDTIWTNNIPQSATVWERLIHAIVKSHFAYPYTNWHEASGNCEDHRKKQKSAQYEVLVTTAVNLFFNMALLIPLVILCKLGLPKSRTTDTQ